MTTLVSHIAAQALRDDLVGEVVHAPPATPLDAGDLTEREQPLDRDLQRRPVPPDVLERGRLAARAAEILRRDRSAFADEPPHLVHRVAVGLAPRVRPRQAAAPARGQVGPVLERQDHREAAVLERDRRSRPVRRLDLRPHDRAEPRVRDELVRAREDRDGVELDEPETPEHRAGIPLARTDERLRAEEQEPCLVGSELDGRAHSADQWTMRQRRRKPRSARLPAETGLSWVCEKKVRTPRWRIAYARRAAISACWIPRSR